MNLVMAKILARVMLSNDLEHLTHAQRSAVIEALALTVVRSGPISDADRLGLRFDLLDLPWAWEIDDQTSDGLVDRRGLKLSRLDDNGVIGRLAGTLARELEDRRLCEHVYRMMVALMYADGGSDRDLAALEPVRAAFGVRSGRAREITDELKDELVALVV